MRIKIAHRQTAMENAKAATEGVDPVTVTEGTAATAATATEAKAMDMAPPTAVLQDMVAMDRTALQPPMPSCLPVPQQPPPTQTPRHSITMPCKHGLHITRRIPNKTHTCLTEGIRHSSRSITMAHKLVQHSLLLPAVQCSLLLLALESLLPHLHLPLQIHMVRLLRHHPQLLLALLVATARYVYHLALVMIRQLTKRNPRYHHLQACKYIPTSHVIRYLMASGLLYS